MKDDPYDPSVADIWSFGVLLAILLTKEWPFEAHSKHSKDLEWKLMFKKNGVPLTDTIYTILSKCFIYKQNERPGILDVLNSFPESMRTSSKSSLKSKSKGSIGSKSTGSPIQIQQL